MDTRRCFFLCHDGDPGQLVDGFVEREEGLQFNVINGGWSGLLTEEGNIHLGHDAKPRIKDVKLCYLDIPASDASHYSDAIGYAMDHRDKLVSTSIDAALLLVKPPPKPYFTGPAFDDIDDDIPF